MGRRGEAAFHPQKCKIFWENTWLRFLEAAFNDALDQIWMLHVSRCAFSSLCVMNIVSFMHAHFFGHT